MSTRRLKAVVRVCMAADSEQVRGRREPGGARVALKQLGGLRRQQQQEQQGQEQEQRRRRQQGRQAQQLLILTMRPLVSSSTQVQLSWSAGSRHGQVAGREQLFKPTGGRPCTTCKGVHCSARAVCMQHGSSSGTAQQLCTGLSPLGTSDEAFTASMPSRPARTNARNNGCKLLAAGDGGLGGLASLAPASSQSGV